MGTVLGDLSALGYDAIWDCVPASAVGAPHQRDRVWIIAYAPTVQRLALVGSEPDRDHAGAGDVADTTRDRWHVRRPRDASQGAGGRQPHRSRLREDLVANAQCGRGEAIDEREAEGRAPVGSRGQGVASAGDADGGGWWRAEPDVGRVAHGVPSRVDRLRSLGNSLVPQIAEMLGRMILAEAL